MKRSTGHAFNWEQERLNRISDALRGSALAVARVQGMKARAQTNPPTAATGGFPYPARTCAEWRALNAIEKRKAANA